MTQKKALYLVGKTRIEDRTNKTNVSFNTTNIMNKFSLCKDIWRYIVVLCFCSTFSFAAIGKRADVREKIIGSTEQHLNQVQVKQNSITGTVSDSNGTLPGVTISIKGKSISTITDSKGSYSLFAESNDVLQFSFIGYVSVEQTVSTRKTINVELKEDITSLREVTVNAGYYKVKDKERTGSIAKITSKDIEKQPVTNVLAAMQGRMAGVSITQESGIAGSGFAVQIRGQNSLRSTGNDPLYVVDGVPYSSESIGSSITSLVLSKASSPLNSINPESIESIEVLKDADATAIYGSRGANGVVLITTKKGREGKTRYSASVSSGLGQITRYMKLMSREQYMAMRTQAYANDGITTYPSGAYEFNGRWDPNRFTDWQKTLLGGTAEFTSVTAGVSGGSKTTQFLLNGSYSKQTTVLPADFAYKKNGFLLNVNHNSADGLFKMVFSGGYTLQNNNQAAVDFTNESRTLAPNAPALYKDDGSLNWLYFNNPLRNLEGKFLSKTNDLLANALFSYQLPLGLELRSSFGFTDLRHFESSTSPSTIYNPAFGIGPDSSVLFLSGASRQSWIAEPQLSWTYNFGKGKLILLAGSTFQEQKGSKLLQQGVGFSSNSLIYNLASASAVTVLDATESVYKYTALFGRANFNWNEKYLINLTGRRDGSSRFGPGKQYGTFGALGVAWLFSNEAIFKNGSSLLSFGKLRASYGTSGNDQIGDYEYLNTYSTTGVGYQGTVGLEPSRLFNPAFGWESNRKLEVAAETGFFKDRVFFTAGYYSNRSSNQLVGVPLPSTTGFASVQANLDATVENSGLELTLRTVNFQRPHFNWTSSVNFTVAKNKLVSFPNLSSSTYANQYVLGQALNIRKVYHLTGIAADGVYQFEDFNNDGQITAPDDMQVVKDLNPKFYGGFQNEFRYKQVQLDFLFQFVKQENWGAVTQFGVPGTRSNQPASVAGAWTSSVPNSDTQLYTSGTNSAAVAAYYNYIESDAAITDASFIRLKNISLTYIVPKKYFKNAQCRIYFQAQNLLTFTKYDGADPEFTSLGTLPPLKVFTTGMQLTF